MFQLDTNNLKAVIILIHSGQYKFGSTLNYGPDFLIEEDIVLVVMNFRLGALGFNCTFNSSLENHSNYIILNRFSADGPSGYFG